MSEMKKMYEQARKEKPTALLVLYEDWERLERERDEALLRLQRLEGDFQVALRDRRIAQGLADGKHADMLEWMRASEQLSKERDEAREVARDCFIDCENYMGEYLFNKHYGYYKDTYPWLASTGVDRNSGRDGGDPDGGGERAPLRDERGERE